MATSRRAFLATLLALPVACALNRRSAADEPADDDYVTLVVINHHALNVTVYNVAGGRRDRIGEVTAVSNATFRLHLRRLYDSELQLLADPIGSRETVTSDRVHLSPDDTVEWTLESDLARSHLMVKA